MALVICTAPDRVRVTFGTLNASPSATCRATCWAPPRPPDPSTSRSLTSASTGVYGLPLALPLPACSLPVVFHPSPHRDVLLPRKCTRSQRHSIPAHSHAHISPPSLFPFETVLKLTHPIPSLLRRLLSATAHRPARSMHATAAPPYNTPWPGWGWTRSQSSSTTLRISALLHRLASPLSGCLERVYIYIKHR